MKSFKVCFSIVVAFVILANLHFGSGLFVSAQTPPATPPGCYKSTTMQCASSPFLNFGEAKICDFTGVYGNPIECYMKECAKDGYTKKCVEKPQ